MGYPRRFYRRTKMGKALKVDEKSIKSCRWCGTFFIVKTQKDFCSVFCYIVSEAYSDVLLIRRDK